MGVMTMQVSGNVDDEAVSLRALFDRLRLGYVADFAGGSQNQDICDALKPVDSLNHANVVTSRNRSGTARHALLLDIDHPAWLVRSSTPGHYHLYIDVPGGIPHERYFALLGALSRAGVIEAGYEKTSRLRGFSSLRLPWVKKEGTDG